MFAERWFRGSSLDYDIDNSSCRNDFDCTGYAKEKGLGTYEVRCALIEYYLQTNVTITSWVH